MNHEDRSSSHQQIYVLLLVLLLNSYIILGMLVLLPCIVCSNQ